MQLWSAGQVALLEQAALKHVPKAPVFEKESMTLSALASKQSCPDLQLPIPAPH